MAHEQFRPNTLMGALHHVIEECGEVLSAAGKTLRFGFRSVNPLIDEKDRETNAAWLEREMIDLELAIQSLRVRMRMAGLTSAPPPAPPEEPVGAPPLPMKLSADERALILTIESGDGAVPGATFYAHVAEGLVHRGYLTMWRAERHPTGIRWYRTTDLGRTAMDAYAAGLTTV